MTDISFAFEIGGKTINPAEVEDKELLADIDYVVEAIVGQVGDLRCPVHNEAPGFHCKGDNFDDISVETYGCCDDLIKKVKERMNFTGHN